MWRVRTTFGVLLKTTSTPEVPHKWPFAILELLRIHLAEHGRLPEAGGPVFMAPPFVPLFRRDLIGFTVRPSATPRHRSQALALTRAALREALSSDDDDARYDGNSSCHWPTELWLTQHGTRRRL